MKILIISIHAVYAYNEKHGTDIAPDELSDETFEAINTEFQDGWSFDSWDDFVSEFNADGPYAPIPSEHRIRVIKKGGR